MCLLIVCFFPLRISTWYFRPVNISWRIFILPSLCIVPQSVEMIHTMWSRNYDDFGFFYLEVIVGYTEAKNESAIWLGTKANSSRKRMLKDIPLTALAEVDAASIFDPFSNSNDPRFQARTPCCIHLGKFSYASCNLPNSSLAVAALFARIPTFTLSLKTHNVRDKLQKL